MPSVVQFNTAQHMPQSAISRARKRIRHGRRILVFGISHEISSLRLFKSCPRALRTLHLPSRQYELGQTMIRGSGDWILFQRLQLVVRIMMPVFGQNPTHGMHAQETNNAAERESEIHRSSWMRISTAGAVRSFPALPAANAEDQRGSY